ncbi:MAG: hypothetical protein L0G99_15190, partial [Propionibacteriales bacterium]|nr:hypothetical protein [Propionibacteriales bacterium]
TPVPPQPLSDADLTGPSDTSDQRPDSPESEAPESEATGTGTGTPEPAAGETGDYPWWASEPGATATDDLPVPEEREVTDDPAGRG